MKKSILLSIITVMIAVLGKAQECTLPANLQNGLVGYWPFNGNTFDESANGNNGTNNGVDFGEDRFGNLNSAGVFDGNDYVLVENAIDQINTSSVCGWFNSAAIQGAAFVQFGNDNPNTGCTGMSIGQGEGDFIGDGNNLHAVLNCTTGWVTGHFELPSPGTWTHFAMVKSPGRLSLFINGVIVAYRIVGEPTFDLQTIFFGASSTSLDYSFQGLLDDIYIYDRNLTEAEVAELYSSNSGLTARIISDGRNTLPVASPVTLTTNEGVYNYQWYLNGNTIDGANQVNYNPITSGTYTVTISNGVCSTTSLPVVITFTENPIMCELPQSSFSNGVIGFWPFCGTYHDLGPNMQNTKSSGATLTTDRYGTPNAAYHFNGSTDFMIVEDALSNLDTISLVGWYKSDFIQGGAFAYVGVNSPVYGCDGIGIGQGEGDYITDGNNLHTDFGCSGGWLGPGIPLPDPGSWNQFGFSKAGDDYRIYLNGQLIQSYQLNTPSFPTNWIFFGAASPGGDYAFSGSLDDLIIFDRALSANEFVQHFEQNYEPVSCNQLPASLQQGLVGYWPFCGNANDESGNENNGVVNGATLTEDRNGNANSAYSFNGINNDITIPNTLDALISNEMTVSMWFNMDDNVDHQSLFLRQGSDFTKTWILAMDGTNEIRCYNENGAYSNVTAPTSLYNAWQQLTAVFTDSVISTYINGVLVAEENVGFPLSWSSEPIILGGTEGTGNNPYPYLGSLDDVGIWNRALTQEEIALLNSGCDNAQALTVEILDNDNIIPLECGEFGYLYANINGGVGPYTFDWTDSNGNPLWGADEIGIGSWDSGMLSLSITDQCGIEATAQIDVLLNIPTLTATMPTVYTAICGSNINLTVVPAGGVTQGLGFNYEWQFNGVIDWNYWGLPTYSAPAVMEGTITVIVSDQCGQSVTIESQLVIESPALDPALQTGLVGYWPFCGGATDESGNGNNGVVNGATLTEDRNGNANSAYSFNGINNDITIPNTLDALISNEMTVSMWFNMDDNVDHQSLFLRQGSDFTKTWILAMDGTNEIRCYNENGAYSNVTAPTSLYNAWQQLTAVFTDSVISTYINGVLVAEENVGFPLSWSSEPIILGGTEGTGNNPYPYLGSLDDIGIWNRALTAEEITQLYGNFTQPIAGCTDNSACNFLASATEDDGSCLFEGSPCDDANASTYNDIIDASCGCVGTPIELGVEHTCGAQLVHNPSLTYGSMTDQEGNVYKTIVIGDQEWMAENLNTSIYRNGDAIATGLDDAAWSTTNTGAWAYYNNDANNACPYGKLYNWYTCVDTRELCPTGWRVPSAQEWTLLTDYLGGDTLAGGRMKTVGVLENSTGLWQSPNLEATNSSGFSGIPGGNRNAGGGYSLFGMFGFWWSTSDLGSSTYAVHQDLIYFDGAAGSYNESDNTKTTGLSVRCLRDANTGLIPGCIDLLACNYNPDATEEDGSCLYPGDTCEDLNPLTENDLLDELCECAGTPIVVNCPTLDPALQNGLVGYWPFCGNANDESGNENDGVVNGATLTEDRFGNAGGALDFDGLNDFVVIPPSPTLDIINDFTVSSWFNADSINDIAMQVKMILGRNGIGSGEGDYTFALSNNQFTELNTEGVVSFSATPYLGIGGTEPTTEQGVVAIDSWYHVAVTFDDTNDSLSYFINGVLVDRVFAQMEINSSDDSLFIGCEVDQPGINYKSFFNGTLDDIGIWNRALTAEEVALLYGSFTQTIPGCTDPSAFNYNPQANQNEGCLYAANVFVYNDLNGNGEHESNEPGLANWPVVGNDINGLLWTNGNGNAFVTVPQGAYQFTVLNTTDNWVLTTEASGILSVGSTNCTDQAGNPTPCPNTTLSFGLQVIPGEAIVAAGPFTGFWEILHCTDGYESGVYLENIGSQTVSGFMTLTCDPLFTPNASSYFTTPPVETGPGYALWNIADFLPGEYELLSYFVPGPGVEYLNAVFNFSLELTLLDPQGNIIFDETWNVSPVVACAYDPNDLTGFPETLSHLPSPENEGYTIEHFVREDEMVEFRVRFQNTGTLPAEDIDIYIPIDATVWDLSTIEPLARAADMQVLCLHDGGDIDFSLYDSLEHELPEGVIATDLLIFSFDDIFLPDSASEPDGSQGYVFFQMQAKHGLDVNTELNAQAFIYFEQNPPITTNETYHVIFDCASFTPMVGDIEICDGESLIFDATQPYVDAYEWRLNNVVIGSANTLQYPAEVGTYTLELNTKNVLCPQGENHEVTVIVHEIPELDLPLNATVCEGEELSYEAESNGSVTWSNGANTGDTFTAAQSFTVTATALGEGNCSTSEDWMVTVNPLPSAAVDSANFVLTALDGIAWQWSVNGADNATTQSITATENGNYQVEITNEFGCVAISDVIEVELPTSVFVHSWSTHHLYPNPMTTGARLELPQGIFDVALYDITGACIRTLSKQQGTVVIERESLASGVYQLQVSQGEVVKSVRLVVE